MFTQSRGIEPRFSLRTLLIVLGVTTSLVALAPRAHAGAVGHVVGGVAGGITSGGIGGGSLGGSGLGLGGIGASGFGSNVDGITIGGGGNGISTGGSPRGGIPAKLLLRRRRLRKLGLGRTDGAQQNEIGA